MFAPPKILLLALVLDAAIGDPPYFYGRVPHPIAVIGRAIGWLDRRWNREDQGDRSRRQAGIVVCLALVIVSAAVGHLIQQALGGFRFGWIIEAVLVSLFLAQNSLFSHVA